MMALRDSTLTLACAMLLTGQALAVDVNWVGSVDNDVTDQNNWDPNTSTPTTNDRAVFSTGSNFTPDLAANEVNWGQMWFNSAGTGTTIDGTGTINLSSTGLSIETAGGPDKNSVINPNVVASGIVRVDGEHNLRINGNVTASKFDAYNNAVLNVYGNATHTSVADNFITTNATGRINFYGKFISTAGGELGLNGGQGGVYFADFDPSNGDSQTINIHDGKTIGLLADNAFNEAGDIWARSASGGGDKPRFDLNGFSDHNEFIATSSGVTLVIDFGETPGANNLNWQASHNMNGLYEVINFEVGTDTLRLGAAGPSFFSDAQLATITINGYSYSTSPIEGVYWDRDENQFVVFHNIPEPAAGALSLLGFACLAGRRVHLTAN